jgi:hypothetical protein
VWPWRRCAPSAGTLEAQHFVVAVMIGASVQGGGSTELGAQPSSLAGTTRKSTSYKGSPVASSLSRH